jgi:hypothetical protein
VTDTDSPERQRTRAEREALQKEYRGLFDIVSEILFRLDPVGINFKTNTDEYEPEVGTILPRLRTGESQADVRRVVHEEFVEWFGHDNSGPEDRYDAIAAGIWKAWIRSAART